MHYALLRGFHNFHYFVCDRTRCRLFMIAPRAAEKFNAKRVIGQAFSLSD